MLNNMNTTDIKVNKVYKELKDIVTSHNKVNELYKELKDIASFLKSKGYGSTVLHFNNAINQKELEAVSELLIQDGIEVRQENASLRLHITWGDMTNMCIYGLSISMAPSKYIIQNGKFQ